MQEIEEKLHPAAVNICGRGGSIEKIIDILPISIYQYRYHIGTLDIVFFNILIRDK